MNLKSFVVNCYENDHYGANWESAFLLRDTEIRLSIKNYKGTLGSLYFKNADLDNDLISVSALMRDVTSVFLDFPGRSRIAESKVENYCPNILWANDWLEKFYKNLPNKYQNLSLIHPDKTMEARYVSLMPPQDMLHRAIDIIEPLAIRGRMLLRPIPALVLKPYSLDGVESKFHFCFKVDPDKPLDEGFVTGTWPESSICLEKGEVNPVTESVETNILLPFISGLSTSDLAKFLDDEEHFVSQMRIAIKTLVESIKKGEKTEREVINDELKPAISKVERKMIQMANIHKIKLAGVTVSTAILSLASLKIDGLAQSPVSLLSPVVGAGGFSLVCKEFADYYNSKSELSELPHYLIWKLGKIVKKSS